jgi:hypothetical protein
VKKHRPCKAFFTTGACQYGDKCYFSHDEAARPPAEPLERPPMPGPPGGVNFEPGGPPPGPGGLAPGPGGPPGPHEGFGGFGGPPRPPTPSQKPPNWKTKICTSWDRHGSCSYGDRCGFAHGPHGEFAFGSGTFLKFFKFSGLWQSSKFWYFPLIQRGGSVLQFPSDLSEFTETL